MKCVLNITSRIFIWRYTYVYMSTYIGIRVILINLISTTFITETFNMVTTSNSSDMVYSQHLLMFHNI